jgi:MFS family permease
MDKGTTPNAHRLLWAGFMAILAAGVGFSIRGGILADWGTQFGFTQSDLGTITGGGLTGFGIIILIGSLMADRVGYGKLMVLAFFMHVGSAIITLAATPIFNSMGGLESEGAKAAAFQCLFWGMFMFAIGNGLAEAVVNPLTAVLFPKQKTHYLNILHAGWPGGLIVGGLLSMLMVGKVRWEIQMGMFLVPAVLYGVMLWGQKFPRDEAGAAGVKYTDMLKELGLLGASVICVLLALFFKNDLGLSTTVATVLGVALLAIFGFFTKFTMGPILMAFLLVIHALVGYVELGTDSWISNITGNILASPGKGLALFVYTSALMFTLRFFAGPIVHRISPLGLLLSSAVFGALGLQLLGTFNTGMAIVFAATIYGIGKTFFWPTMLAVVSEQFPKGGAITMGSIGCVGMLSAGLLGSTGIGYKQDRFAAEHLQAASPAAYEAVKSENSNAFLIFKPIQGLDGAKVGEIKAKPAAEQTDNDKLVLAASLDGARSALKMTALIPVTMGVCYLLLIFYFKSRGGYKAVEIGNAAASAGGSGDSKSDS